MEVQNYKHHLPSNIQHLWISQEEIDKEASPHSDMHSVALVLVGERHRKSDLVDLVSHLLRGKHLDKLSECG